MIKTQYDALTGVTTEIEFNDIDLEQLEKDQLIESNRLAELKVKADAKAALLERLGITAEEAELLLG